MLDLTPIPSFTDNYIWGLSDGQQAWLIDPGEAAPARQWLQTHKLDLTGILITHHHSDHIGGVQALLHHNPKIPVYGPDTSKIKTVTVPLKDGTEFNLGPWRVAVLGVPAHTLDHIAYYLAPNAEQPGILFCGDTLFGAGCGRLFEGSPKQLHQALKRFKTLPPETLMCCAHEYTLSNLAFAQQVEPGNRKLQERQQQEQCKREAGLPTLPSTLAVELATNPFLRPHSPEIQVSAKHYAKADVIGEEAIIATLRQWKDNF
ncbi:hydroxyacylglutathione hydrolase [Simiduia litorea]|uniref:hydroxyacylglutathione hydrolase n=1 Tax=Simiduia litorea TaxID=1435348 RepID=UPI0036F2E080